MCLCFYSQVSRNRKTEALLRKSFHKTLPQWNHTETEMEAPLPNLDLNEQ